VAKNASGAIVTNEEDRIKLTGTLASICPPLVTIPIGSNIPTRPPEGYNTQTWREERGILDNELLLGFFGFMNRSKGVDILLSAVANLYDAGLPVKLIFIGGRTGTSDKTNSEYADYIDATIQEKGLADIILRTGFVTPEQVSAALYAVDICTLPYLEGASLRHGTLHAAIAHSCAIVTTRSTQMDPELDRNSLYLLPPNNIKALEKAIIRVWQNKSERLTLQNNALILSRSFGWDNIAEQTARFFSQILN
jgi:glycosyltransferase involved in cell wall biosynthesis